MSEVKMSELGEMYWDMWNTLLPEDALSCYGCIHLKYTGPSEIKDRPRFYGQVIIPLNESDKGLEPGHYSCSRFKERICRADSSAGPVPLVAGGECKEGRES